MKSALPFGIVGEVGGQDLQRDVTAKFAITRSIDFAHASRPEKGDDFITSQPCSRKDGHGRAILPECQFPSFKRLEEAQQNRAKIANYEQAARKAGGEAVLMPLRTGLSGG